MSRTVDVGIDLGTTNSVVAVMDGETAHVHVCENDEDSKLTPSYVGFDEHGNLQIGEPALRIGMKDPENVASGFKRQLGTGITWTFPVNAQSFTSVDLTALILRDLRRTAAGFLNYEPESAVITVPAVFGEVEKSALMKSAKEAGLSHATLVQEPVAAGLAYGWGKSQDDRPFLIYDLGGGTFDLSLMQSVGGRLIVRDHVGEHTLGGRDLDKMIFEKLIKPKLTDGVAIEELRRKMGSLLWRSEEAKIRLSRHDSATVSIEGVLTSITGNPIDDVISISLSEYKELLIPFVDHTVEIVNRLLAVANIELDGISGLVLVGGPCRTPALRERLQERLGVAINTKLNPMTVVAQGAALYAASIIRSDIAETVTRPDVISLRLEYDPVSSLPVTPVGMVARPKLLDSSMVRLERTDGLWASGWIAFQNSRAVCQATLLEGAKSFFRIELVDPSGNTIKAQPNEFSIIHGLEAASPPLSRSIGVIVESESNEGAQISLDLIARRGDPTPLVRRGTYLTSKPVTSGDTSSAITVRFVEGESSRPFRNRAIGIVPINGTDLEQSLPAGTKVEITLLVQPSSEATAKVFIDDIDKTFMNKLQIEINKPPDLDMLRVRLETEKQRLRDLSDAGASVQSIEAVVLLVEEEFEGAAAGDRDNMARVTQWIENLESEADTLEKESAPQLALQTLEEYKELAEGILSQFGDEDQLRRLSKLKAKGERARLDHDSTSARAVSEGLLGLASEVWWSQTGPWVSRFETLVSEAKFVDRERAQRLTKEGRQALDAGDVDLLRRVVVALQNLTPSPEDDSLFSQFRGLMKL